MKCNYCNLKEGIFQLKNGKYCCDKNISQCPSIKTKYSLSKLGKPSSTKGLKFGKSPNKGKKYEEIYGDRSAEIKEKIKKAKSENPSGGRASTEEKEQIRRKKLSEIINKRYELGWCPKAGRCKKIKYYSKIAGDILLDGNWELIVAKYFDHIEINWTRNKNRFKYINLKNKDSFYTPDFYLSDNDLYVEVKGYETNLDRCKWKQFPHKLLIWKKNEINIIKANGSVF